MIGGLIRGPGIGCDLSRAGVGLSSGPKKGRRLNGAPREISVWPSPTALLDLDFENNRGYANGVGQGSAIDLITFSRLSGGTHVNSQGVLTDAQVNTPRFDWLSGAYTGTGTKSDPFIISSTIGARCKGILVENAATNLLLWSRDQTNAAWDKTGTIAAKDQIGIDGAINSACSVIATVDNGTCTQSISVTSASRIGSLYVKRLTGTGEISVTIDGVTWAPVSITPDWCRVSAYGTSANPVVGVKIGTNGDSIAVDYAQVEQSVGASQGPTSAVLTTTTSATRAADVAVIQLDSRVFDRNKGTIYADASSLVGSISFGSILVSSDDMYSVTNYSISFERKSDAGGMWLAILRNYVTVNFSSSVVLYNIGESARAALAYNHGGSRSTVNGMRVGGLNYDTTPLLTAARFLNVGRGGVTKRIIVFPKLFSDSALMELTQ